MRHEVVGEAHARWRRRRQNGAPVSAACRPSSPGARDSRMSVPPTSGMKPMPTSGIAIFVVSVTTPDAAVRATPTPPPITMPSIERDVRLGEAADLRR